MKRIILTLVLIASAAWAGRAAQASPNLSGTWRPQNPLNLAGPEPFEVTITQTADAVTLHVPLQSPDVVLKFDGTPAANGAHAAWEGSKLAVSTPATGRGGMATKQLLSMSGDQLTIETTVTRPDGTAQPSRSTPYVRYTPVPLPAPPAAKVESGFVSLFDGKTLTGWKVGGNPDSFKAENGYIVANGVGGAAHLFYDGPVGNHAFKDFDLKVDAVARYRSNGGVYVMTEFLAQGFPTAGFEIQVNNSHTDRIRTGSLYHVVDLSNIPAKDDEWMPMEIVARGNTITVSVKGEEVLKWVQPANWQTNYDTPSRRIAPGTIAFQAHDPYSVTAYSNVRIKLLN